MTNSTSAPAASPSAASGSTDATQSKSEAILAQLRAANAKLAGGDSDGALAMVNATLQANPQSIGAFALRGAIYSQKKMWAQAENDFEAAHMLAPNNPLIKFNLAETKFVQKQYDAARPGFLEISADRVNDIGDLAAYKTFLCDLLGGHMDTAQKELDEFNKIGSKASYYYANAAWDFVHQKTQDANGWISSATAIYSPEKNGFYRKSLIDQGYLMDKPVAR